MTEGEQPAVDDVKPERKSSEELEKLDKSALIEQIDSLFDYIEAQKHEDVQALRVAEEKCRQQVTELTRREMILVKSLGEKEREITDLAAQVEDLKQYQLPSNNQLRTMQLEPTVNILINKLRKEQASTKLRLEESQSELNAWKFTQDSQTGKQLMARCRTLLKENEELGKQISQGRVAKLEGEIALEKRLVDEMKVAQNETEQFVMELDDDTEGLQATIYLLQHQLKIVKDRIEELEGSGEGQPTQSTTTPVQPPNHSDTIGQDTADPSLTVDSKPLTLSADEQQKAEETHGTPATSPGVMVNGTDSAEMEDIEPAKSEKVTASNEKCVTMAASNGHTEAMVTN